MNLDELKFRLEDAVVRNDQGAFITIERANEILLSRLRKAERIYGQKVGGKMNWQSPEPWPKYGNLQGVIVEVGERPAPKSEPLPTGYPYNKILPT